LLRFLKIKLLSLTLINVDVFEKMREKEILIDKLDSTLEKKRKKFHLRAA
jgi:hypothetical protein